MMNMEILTDPVAFFTDDDAMYDDDDLRPVKEEGPDVLQALLNVGMTMDFTGHCPDTMNPAECT